MAAGERRRRVEAKLDCIADPFKRSIYWALKSRPASAAEVAADLGVAVEKVRYQIRSMRKVGVVEAVGRTRRRGVPEGLFQVCDQEMMISAADLSAARPALVERSHLASIAKMWREVRVPSAGERPDDAREFGHLTKVDLLFDAQGWSEAHRLLTDAAAEIKAVRDRLPEGDGPPSPEEYRLFLVLFESLLPGSESGARPEPPPAKRPALAAEVSRARKPLGSRQMEIVKLLSFRPAGTVELASLLELPVHRVKSDLRSLRGRGLVFVCDERARRNTVEHVYAVDYRRYEDAFDDLGGASSGQLLEHYDALTRSACGDLVESMKAGALKKRSDYVLMRIPLPGDAELMDAAAKTLRRTFAATIGVAEASRSRLQTSGEVPTCAQSTILFSSLAR